MPITQKVLDEFVSNFHTNIDGSAANSIGLNRQFAGLYSVPDKLQFDQFATNQQRQEGRNKAIRDAFTMDRLFVFESDDRPTWFYDPTSLTLKVVPSIMPSASLHLSKWPSSIYPAEEFTEYIGPRGYAESFRNRPEGAKVALILGYPVYKFGSRLYYGYTAPDAGFRSDPMLIHMKPDEARETVKALHYYLVCSLDWSDHTYVKDVSHLKDSIKLVTLPADLPTVNVYGLILMDASKSKVLVSNLTTMIKPADLQRSLITRDHIQLPKPVPNSGAGF